MGEMTGLTSTADARHLRGRRARGRSPFRGHRAALRRWLPLALVTVTLGCASAKPNPYNLTPAQWEQEVRRRGVDPREVPDPLAVTDAMRQEARRIAGTGTALEQLRKLQLELFASASSPFEYDNRATLTAAEAFHRRQGNCLSFTNLFVALGRSLGVPVTTALVLRVRGSEREGDLIVVNTHVIAVLYYAGGAEYYDFDRSRDRRPTALRPLEDMWITALYLNNRGADELRAGHPAAARKLFEETVRLAPAFAAGWGNLGVTRRRLGDVPGAFAAYEQALSIEHDNPTVLANLSALYASLGKTQEARLALEAGNVSQSSPHVLIVRGDLELAQGRPRDAMKFFKRARSLAPDLPDAWVALAKCEIVLGKRHAAQRSLARALKLRPDLAEARELLRQVASSPPTARPNAE